jgi:aromatic-L-amino-acid/L-tryptophan decarboxylase
MTNNLLTELKKLEKSARTLEPTPEQRENIRKKIIKFSENFLNNIYNVNAFNQYNKGSKNWFSDNYSQTEKIDSLLSELSSKVCIPGLNPASPGHLGYIPGGGLYYSSLGDYLADITNEYAGVDFAGPGAVELEESLIRWMLKLVGYGKNAAGNLASGGSIANLICVTAARDAFGAKSKDFSKMVVYSTAQVHHCIDKAIRIAGLGESVKRTISTDRNSRMIAEDLEKQIKKDISKGLLPFLIIASAGTTDTGAVDPLYETGKIANKYKIWYHIDAAYGGFFILTQKGKKLLKGTALSDSIVMDPHKGLFLPYGLGVALVKNKKDLHKSHYYQANYLQDAHSETLSPAELSPELTKHFRGLRLWLPLKLHGIEPFVNCLEEKLLLAQYFYTEIKKIKGFEVGPQPQLSVVNFRYVPENGNANRFNELLMKEIHKDGRVFLSSTKIKGEFTLRLAILSFRTHKNTIDLALSMLKDCVNRVKNN